MDAARQRLVTQGPRSVDQDLVIQDVLGAVKKAVACEQPFLLLAETDEDFFRLHVSAGSEGIRIPSSEPSVIRRILRSGRAEVVNDLNGDPDSSPLLAETVGAHQVAGVPLRTSEGVFGVLGTINSKHDSFNDSDLQRLEVVAENAALQIENARLHATLSRQVQEIEGLHRMTRLLTSAETVDQVVEESVRIVADLLECESTALLIYEEEANALIAHHTVVGLSHEQLAALAIPMSRPSLAASVFRTGSALLSNDAKNDAWVEQGFAELLAIESVLIVPLTSAGQPTGVLMMTNANKGHFTQDDARFATLLGNRIGSVLDGSRGRERERALVQRLREIDHTKSEFVSMLAHELKGPMTTVVGFATVLREGWPQMTDDKRNHILGIVSKETERLSRLVADLLDLSRMEAGTLRYDPSDVPLQEALDGLLEFHTSITRSHSVELDIPADLPAVRADPDRLRQVLLNLLSNAARYSEDGTAIRLTARVADSGHVQVSVTDQGIGISPEDLDRVFGKFIMLDKPGWVAKGTGLGLFITKGIVEAHKGSLWVESREGKGSTFHFTIPPSQI